jgi:two-component system, NtrC family, response regulator HydG
MSKRISLSEASKRAPGILARGDSQLLAEGAPPTLQDLAGALQFALGDGRIWLNDQRMLLVQAEVLGQLRSAMIDEIGMDRTRERFLQIGWQQGVRHARLVAERFGKSDMTAALAAGPRVHTMEGHAKAITKRFEFNAKKQEYLGEFHWLDSSEGTEHMRNFGICDCPVCWMQIAVPSGYTSTLLGFPVIFREIECVAQGAQRCVIVGKDAASWGDELPELKIFGVDGKPRPKAKPWTPPVDIEAVKTAQSDFVIGTSPAIQRVRRLIERAGACRQPVMFIGEQGSGKEDLARYLHSVGETPKGPFVPVSCFALDGLNDSAGDVLFGDEGLARQAEGGTLFLNDVLALPASIQAKFAHFLYGQPRTRFRIVSAASQSPMDAVKAGTFRTDLGYMLSLLPIHAPPLRERRSDLPVLIDHFRKRHTGTPEEPPCSGLI